MLRRLLAVVVLVVVVLAVFAYLRRERLGNWSARANPPDVAAEARDLGAQAKKKLDEVGHELKDAKVTASVKTALGLNRNLRSYSINVSTENGVVTLRGKVDSEDARARVQAVAAEVPDVQRVVNEIQVVPGTSASAPASGRTLGETVDDQALEMKVRLALSLNRELKDSDITVQVYRKDVTLGGEVTTPSQRERALQVARETPSVSNVIDRIHVRGTADAKGTGPATAANAPCTATAAQRALQANRNLSALDLQVREEGGRLVLRGTVRTPTEKDLAGLVAREGAGCPVENDVEVRSATL
jgi:hyperosmotically inducible periplasmic protein